MVSSLDSFQDERPDIVLHACAELFGCESRLLRFFHRSDPIHPQNEVVGVICRKEGNSLGSMIILQVNGVFCGPQIIRATPKLLYPYQANDNSRELCRFDDRRANGYFFSTKWDGTNICFFTYHDGCGQTFVSFKTRGTPFATDHCEFGSFSMYTLRALLFSLQAFPPVQVTSSSTATSMDGADLCFCVGRAMLEDQRRKFPTSDSVLTALKSLYTFSWQSDQESCLPNTLDDGTRTDDMAASSCEEYESALQDFYLGTDISLLEERLGVASTIPLILAPLRCSHVQCMSFELCASLNIPMLVWYDEEIASLSLRPLFLSSSGSGRIRPIHIQSSKERFRMVDNEELPQSLRENILMLQEECLQRNQEFRRTKDRSSIHSLGNFATEGYVLYVLDAQGWTLDRSMYKVKPRDIEEVHWRVWEDGDERRVVIALRKIAERELPLTLEVLCDELDISSVEFDRLRPNIMRFLKQHNRSVYNELHGQMKKSPSSLSTSTSSSSLSSSSSSSSLSVSKSKKKAISSPKLVASSRPLFPIFIVLELHADDFPDTSGVFDKICSAWNQSKTLSDLGAGPLSSCEMKEVRIPSFLPNMFEVGISLCVRIGSSSPNALPGIVCHAGKRALQLGFRSLLVRTHSRPESSSGSFSCDDDSFLPTSFSHVLNVSPKELVSHFISMITHCS